MYPESFANWEMEVVVRPIAPWEEIVIPVPPVKPMFVRALEVETRSARFCADWRKKPVFSLAAVPKFKEEEDIVKVMVEPVPEMASMGPEVAKVKAGPVIVVPCTEMVVVAEEAEVEVTYLLPAVSKRPPWTWIYPEAVRFVRDAFWRFAEPVTVSEPPFTPPEDSRFVEDTEAKVDWPETERELSAACPVVFKVATWRFPVPVAFVKVRPWREEAPETLRVPPTIFPDAAKLVADALPNWELPDTISVPE